jgi:hypothetical protein
LRGFAFVWDFGKLQFTLKTKVEMGNQVEGQSVSPNDAKPVLPAVFRHKFTGNVGYFVKEYEPTGKPLTMQIKLADGRIYFAPKHEFE